MDSYYDTIIEQCRSLMAQGHHAQAQALLEEELSMPYIPKPFEETIIALYNECRSTLRLHGGVVREVHDVEELLKGSVEEQLQAVEQLRSSNIRNHLPAVREAMKQGSSAWVNAFLIEALCEQNVSEEFTLERDGLSFTFVPCALTLPAQNDALHRCVDKLRSWFESENPSFLSQCVEALMQEAYLRLPMDIDETECIPLAIAVVRYVYEAYEMPKAFDAFLKEKNLAPEAGYELLLEKHDCSFG